MSLTQSSFGKIWTQEENELLQVAVTSGGGTKAAVKALPHRSKDAITVQIRKLKLRGRQKGRWTAAEDRKLRQMWGVEPMLGIVKLLCRTQRAVYTRAVNELGLTASVPEGWERITDAATRTGYSINAMWRILKEANIVPMRSYSLRDEGAANVRYYIVESADVDFAVEVRGGTETLFGAATRRDMSADTLKKRLASIGITPAKKQPPRWDINATDLQRVLAPAEYDALRAGVMGVMSRRMGDTIPMHRISKAGFDTEDLRKRLLTVGLKAPVRKDVWRIRTEDIDRAIREYDAMRAQREPVAQAARRVGVSGDTLSKWLKRNGVSVRRRLFVSRMDVDRVVAIERPSVGGEMVTEAARRVGIHHSTLYTWLREGGVPIRRGSRIPAETIDRIVGQRRYRPSGEILSVAAKRIGIRAGTLSKWLRRHEVPFTQGVPIPVAEINRIAALMRPPGETVPEAAQRIGLYRDTLRKWLKRAGAAFQKGYPYMGGQLMSPTDLDAFVANIRRRPEETVQSAARRVGVNHQTLSKWLTGDGVKIRNGCPYRDGVFITRADIDRIVTRFRPNWSPKAA